jgi:hypothetical protein
VERPAPLGRFVEVALLPRDRAGSGRGHPPARRAANASGVVTGAEQVNPRQT